MSTKKNAARLALAGIAAGAAAAGYYFYASKDAAKNRRAAQKWARDMKGEVVREAKKLKNIDKKNIALIVDNAARAYRSAKNIDAKELSRAAQELKTHWQLLAAEITGGAKKSARKKTAKKAARKRAS